MAKCMEFYFPCEASEMLTEVPKKIKKSVFMHAYSITEKNVFNYRNGVNPKKTAPWFKKQPRCLCNLFCCQVSCVD